MDATPPHHTILITGASRGIGHAIATHLLTHTTHTRLVLVARTEGPLRALQAQYPDRVRYVTGDLGGEQFGAVVREAVRAGVTSTTTTTTTTTTDAPGVAAGGGGGARLVGLVVNHARFGPVGRVADISVEDWADGLRVNFLSCVEFVKEALPYLRSSKGRIIFTSSGASVHPYTGCGAYGLAKAALNHLAMTLSVEEPDVVSVAVRPGVVDTQIQDEIRDLHGPKMAEKDWQKFVGLKRDGKLLRPEEPGSVMARLVLEADRDLSGKLFNWNDAELEKYRDQ